MNFTKILTAGFLTLAVAGIINAQEYPVGTANISDCGGFLVDSGLSASDYGANENLTTVICHDGTESPLVSLYFAFFELGDGDFLTIYDGSTTAAASLGTYGGNDLQGLDITSTNQAGCLTIVFTSNSDSSVGSFGAQISCTTPCDRPVPSLTVNGGTDNPLRVCPDEVIYFDGSTSTFAEGASYASHVWDFGDGTTSAQGWPSTSHSYSTPGAYRVQLSLVDNNGCTSGILTDQLIFVATVPDMSLTSDDMQVCVGQEVHLTGSAEPKLWVEVPTANFGGALFIPDDQSQCFSDTLLFGGFGPNAAITTEEDLAYFFINFEHSFMGDLVISFICPNGQSIAVHQQGGSGTYLGIPVDDGSSTPGVGFDYYWTPTATNGTWADNGTGSTLPSGRYESSQPFSNLIGCPLNGEWIVEVCDLWSIDNGFIFDWSVQFADYLYADLLSFTPSIGAGCDSTFISGPSIISSSSDCDSATVQLNEPGNYTYTYTAYDNHGCTYTQNITVNAYPGPIPTAGADFNYCGTAVALNGTVTNPVQGINYVYSWSPSQPLSNANTASPMIQSLSEPTLFTLSVYPAQDPTCLVSDQVNVNVPQIPVSVGLDTLIYCYGTTGTMVAPQTGEGFTYVWSYAGSDPYYTELATGNFVQYEADQPGFYQVEIIEPLCLYSSTTEFFSIIENCEIIIPNVFTPNNDSKNDNFEIFGLEKYSGSSMQIYNRWGTEIYSSDNYRNNWNGEGHAEGTYYFILGVKQDNKYTYHEGHVTLLRD